MEQPTITRRALLASTPIAALAVAAPMSVAASGTLAQAIAAYHAAAADRDAYYRVVYGPAHETWVAARNAVPHYTTSRSFVSLGGKTLTMSTDRSIDVKIVQGFEDRPYSSAGDDFKECCRELHDALRVRKAKMHEIRRDFRIDELEDEYERLGDIADAAIDAVETFPVVTLADLIAKLEFSANEDPGDVPLYRMLADLRRINGEG